MQQRAQYFPSSRAEVGSTKLKYSLLLRDFVMGFDLSIEWASYIETLNQRTLSYSSESPRYVISVGLLIAMILTYVNLTVELHFTYPQK